MPSGFFIHPPLYNAFYLILITAKRTDYPRICPASSAPRRALRDKPFIPRVQNRFFAADGNGRFAAPAHHNISLFLRHSRLSAAFSFYSVSGVSFSGFSSSHEQMESKV